MVNNDEHAPSEGTKKLNQPSLRFGNDCLASCDISSAELSFYLEEKVMFSAASLCGVPPEDLRWDYRATTTLFENEDLIRTGICVKASLEAEESVEFTLRDSFWELEQKAVRNIEIFGMSNSEIRYWFLQLAGHEVSLSIEDSDDGLRPFIYAVPLKGLTATGEPKSFFVRDFGVVSGEYDTVFARILNKSNFKTVTSVWDDEVPKAWGTVYARDMLEAERLALARARFTADLIGFALRTGISHFDSRYETEPLEWDAEVGRAIVSLHPFILLSEVKEPKGWIRSVPLVDRHKEIDLGDCYERIAFFAERFVEATQAGDFVDQVKKRQLSKRERKLSVAIQRSLRWQAIAADEDDLCDRFIAVWISLEAILDAVDYPGVFEKGRRPLRDSVKQKIGELSAPEKATDLLTVSKEMLRNRILQDQWPLPRKLEIFAKVFGVELRPDDLKLVRDLSKARGAVFHAGNDNPVLLEGQIQQLVYLVERLVVATSIFGYEDLEDGRRQLQFGQIGPEGGAAPLFLDGREVPYRFCVWSDRNMRQVWEVNVEGKLYNVNNADLGFGATGQDQCQPADGKDHAETGD